MKFINSPKKAQQGFTLIELVVVIVILGILAVTAAPKFIDLTSDAREAAMDGVKGSIESAVSLAQSKALIEGETGGTGAILIGTKYYALVNGYPAAASIGTKTGDAAVNALGVTFLVDLDSGSDIETVDAATALFQHTGATDKTECRLSYSDAADNETRPEILKDYDKC